jgi:spermidine synthase
LHRIAYLAFFASGFAALLYQTVWQRMLTFFGGADIFSITITVAAFMAGLGCGSLVGGTFADRLGQRARLLAFAGAELAVALFAVASTAVFYDVLYRRLGAFPISGVVLGTTLFAVLLWPTFFMGMSLPLLARALAEEGSPGERVASLYGWNTLGAAIGSLITVWALFRAMDFEAALRIGAALNLACAAAGVFLASRTEARSEARRSAPAVAVAPGVDATRADSPKSFSFRTWLFLYALSGFVALSLEILWFRVLGVLIKSSSFTFGSLLAVYLGGVGLGALLGRRLAVRSGRPGETFLLIQAMIPVVAGFALVVLVHALGDDGSAMLLSYVAGYEPVDVAAAARALGALFGTRSAPAADAEGAALAMAVVLYLLVPVAVIGPPTVLMGASFTYLQCAVQTDLRVLGRRVGWLQAANIVGSMLGAIVTGLCALHWLGTSGTQVALIALGAPFLLAYERVVRERRAHRMLSAIAAAVLLAALASMPSANKLWARLHGSDKALVIASEDRSGLAVLIRKEQGVVVYANGIGQSTLPFGGIHTVLGALPAMVHPSPEAAVVIGLGSGDTLFSIGGRPETRTIHSIEIVAPALDALRILDERGGDVGLSALLRDPRVRHHFTDGRAFLARSSDRYDIIEADALRPSSAYAGNLFSTEYFELLRDRLKPGGIAVSWAASSRVVDTFVKVFPYVVLAPHILLGSSRPLSFDPAAIRERLRAPFTRDYYAAAGIDIENMMEPYLATQAVYGPEFDRTTLRDVNHDLFPKDEFMVPRSVR